MNKTKKQSLIDIDEDEVFDDSTLLANFENSVFREDTHIDINVNQNLNVSALCCDEEISGYDRLIGKTWIYPTNYPIRDYQFNIIQAAIVKNTLVSLPTGLGKTFIAAVIMYNFYRWYPLGKIVFTAPTRPLVAQQIEACYSIVAMPPKDTIEMTGHMQVSMRKQHWQSKRVFFATPQVIYNDIKSGICPAEKLRCLIFDEAHRARGIYAYCQIMSTLNDMGHKTFRVLALSATPGSKVEDVVNVVKNLNIAHLELRTESCIDVAPYSHSRKINTVIIQLGPELTHLRQQYVGILDGYARRLIQLNILPHNVGNLSKGRVVMLYKEFQSRDRNARHPQHNIIMKDFTLIIALYHGLELLVKHGSRVFLNFFDEHPEKSWIQRDDKLTALLERLRDDLGINPLSLDRSILPDGTVPEMPKDLSFGHPKFYKLKEIIVNHFRCAKNKEQVTKAIVFCEYRESVNLVHCLLLQCRPLIVPLMFVGQGASGKNGKTVVSQKQQLRVMKSFREGACNTLVCTCVAEEGLDVGSVDLIICFDISTRSPIRLVQRCGRTGRERGGRVHILVTEGREHQTLIDCMRQRDGLNSRIQQSQEVANSLYKSNPRMIPHDFMPELQKMHITVPKKVEKDSNKARKGQKDLLRMLQNRPSISNTNNTNVVDGELITEVEFNELFPEGFDNIQRLPEPKEYWNMKKDSILESSKMVDKHAQLNSWLEWQRNKQTTINIGHSVDSEILTSLLKYRDNKRFDEPSLQDPTFNAQEYQIIHTVSSPVKPKRTKKKVKSTMKSPNKKDGDIRALFSTTTKSTKDYTNLLNDLGIQNDGKIPTSLINLLVDLNLEVTNNNKKCYICSSICDCTLIAKNKYKEPIKPMLFLKGTPNLPDLDFIHNIDAESILKCSKSNAIDSNNDIHNQSENFNLEFDFDSPETPKTHKNDNNFDIGDIEDIFENSSPEELNIATVNLKEEKPKETLEFFGLDSIEDIFAESDEEPIEKNKSVDNKHINENKIDNTEIPSDHDDVIVCGEKIKSSNDNTYRIKSPSLLSGRDNYVLTSPILCSKLDSKKKNVKCSTPFTARRKIILESEENMTTKEKNNASNLVLCNNPETSGNKSLLTITQLVEMINKSTHSKSGNTDCSRERSLSPILLSQADRKLKTKPNTSRSLSTKRESLIILESDSDSDEDTQRYEAEPKKPLEQSQCHHKEDDISSYIKISNNVEKNKQDETPKRKLDDEDGVASPYFNKMQKIEKCKLSLTLREKILATVSSHKFNNKEQVTLSPQLSQKENRNPHPIIKNHDSDRKLPDSLKKFQNLKQNCQVSHRSIDFAVELENGSDNNSDDDFVCTDRNYKERPKLSTIQTTPNHKVRKKKQKANEFLDLEAELSSEMESGDELSEDSAGSLVEFLDDAEMNPDADMEAHYLQSVKSPVKGLFKIPQLPKKFNNEEILSQFEEEDTYEMDSFCVDSHIGLTQANDMSELEIAEMIIEEKRRKRKLPRNSDGTINSPMVRQIKKRRRIIDSDSDSS